MRVTEQVMATVPRKPKRKRPSSEQEETAPVVLPKAVVSCASDEKRKAEGKKRRRKKIWVPHHEQSDSAGDPAGPHAPQHAVLVAHVGVDKINSNWKQLQATLKKGRTAGATQKLMHNEPVKGSDKFQTKGAETVKESQLETLSPRSADCSLTKVLAMDCEMVGAGLDGKRSILARVSLVNIWGNVVYDKHVRPMERVTDFRTKISGVRACDLRKAEDFAIVQKEVAELLSGRVLVGHAIQNDLKIMYLSHPKKDMRDTAAYLPLHSKNGRPRALRHIAAEILGVTIQVGEHCSVQDARAAMYVYQHLKHDWEEAISKRH